jgi:hypothetical protein
MKNSRKTNTTRSTSSAITKPVKVVNIQGTVSKLNTGKEFRTRSNPLLLRSKKVESNYPSEQEVVTSVLQQVTKFIMVNFGFGNTVWRKI